MMLSKLGMRAEELISLIDAKAIKNAYRQIIIFTEIVKNKLYLTFYMLL